MAESRPMVCRGSSAWHWSLAALLLLAGLGATFYPTLLSGFDRLQENPGDTRLVHYFLEHTYQWLTGDPHHARLWDPPFYHPKTNVLAYSETMLSVAPAYCLWRAIGLERDLAFSAWMISMAAINYVVAWFFLRRAVGASSPASSCGAFLIAFASVRISQLGHQQLLPHFYTILALHGLWVLLGRVQLSAHQRAVAWTVTTLSGVAQFYACFYYGFFLFLVLLTALGWSLARREFRQRLLAVLRRDSRMIAAATFTAVALLAPLAHRYLMAADEIGLRSAELTSLFLPRLASYFWMGETSILYGWTHGLEVFHSLPIDFEHSIGLGAATTCILIWYFCSQQQMAVRMMLLVVLTLVICFTMFPGEMRLFQIWYHTIPGMQAIRVVVRLGILLCLPAGIALAAAIDAARARRLGWVAITVAALCCVEQLHFMPHYDRHACRHRVEAIKNQIQRVDAEAVYLTWDSENEFQPYAQLDAMWASMLARVPTVNGYTGGPPRHYGLLEAMVVDTPAERSELVADFRAWSRRNKTQRAVFLVLDKNHPDWRPLRQLDAGDAVQPASAGPARIADKTAASHPITTDHPK